MTSFLFFLEYWLNLKNFSPIGISMNEIKIELIEPREPSIELILEMIDDASKKKSPSNDYIRQQLADLIIVKKLIDKA